MKVIASSLRKGAVVDMDGKLYVVLSAENIHPGKGTPVTQLDMRRISDTFTPSEMRRMSSWVTGVPLPGWMFSALSTT